MLKTFQYLLISVRPKQWLKNLSIYIPILFWGYFLTGYKFWPVTKGFLIFCGLASSIYLFNDYRDRDLDRLHPGKKNRPLAAGLLNPNLALIVSLFLAIASLICAFCLSEYFFVTCSFYVLMMTAYSVFFRRMIIFDGLIIAFGFVLRVWAGGVVSETPISSWLILCTTATALLIAFGRRRCEITLLESKASKHRNTLQGYPTVFLDAIITSVAAFSLVSYSLFTFFNPGPSLKIPWLSYLPLYWENSKWLMITIPIAIYGIFRYLFIIYEKRGALSPEEVIFEDKPLLISIFLWFSMIFLITYIF